MTTFAGILLPQSIFTSSWFVLLATVVAFNTIVYVGLTLAKLIPLPRQFHPARVRGWLLGFGLSTDRKNDMAVPIEQMYGSEDPHEVMRGNTARRDIPQAFAFAGGIVILLSVISFLSYEKEQLQSVLTQLLTGLVLLFLSQLLGRRSFTVRTIVWVWAAMSVAIVLLTYSIAIDTDAQTPIAYSLVVMTAFAPITLAWRPALVAGFVMMLAVVVAAFTVEGAEDLRLIASALVALSVSYILLHLRLSSMDAVTDEQLKTAAVASTDSLTGLLTRNGLLSLMPGLGGIAERANEPVCVMVFRVDDMSMATKEYGVLYRQEVLKAVAAAIRNRVRTGDLISRWGADTFVVAGLGQTPAADAITARIEYHVREQGVSLGKWPTTVSVGAASGDATQTTFNQILRQAAAAAGTTIAEEPANATG